MPGVSTVYTDVDGTLVGPGGDLMPNGSLRVVEAIVACRAAGIDLVPVSGRGRVQVRELCRLLGMARGIAELGCIHLEGREARYELGGFPFVGETPVEAMRRTGAIDLMTAGGLEPHEPWNEGREATYLLRGEADVGALGERLQQEGLGWCALVDNGLLGRGGRVLHLAPAGTGKATGVALDRARHGLRREDTIYVGDAATDLACAGEVGECWLVANADPHLDWPLRTRASHGDGLAEVLERHL